MDILQAVVSHMYNSKAQHRDVVQHSLYSPVSFKFQGQLRQKLSVTSLRIWPACQDGPLHLNAMISKCR